MSSNINDNNSVVITLDNYEEYLLMYVDDELSVQERSLVEAFLKFHPGLLVELDLLMSAKLEPETITFGAKENLMADNIREAGIDEALLMHVDGELPETEKKPVEERLQQDEAYRRQYQLLLRTKSDPAEVVFYPNKDELYRHTVYHMRFGFALRIAAAVLLLASLGVVFWMQQQKEISTPAVANREQAGKQPRAIELKGKADNVEGQMGSDGLASTKQNSDAGIVPVQGNVSLPAQEQTTNTVTQSTRKAESATPNATAVEKAVATSAELLAQASGSRINPFENDHVERVHADKNSFTPEIVPVTPPSVVEPILASSNSEEGQEKNNLKVLLRKATRLVERRAHINATNEDEELLIGALAIKLK